MAKLNLSLGTLGELDGGTAELLVNHEIARAVSDLYDRGQEDGKSRKVAIELEVSLMDGGLVAAHLACQAKLPPRRTKGTATAIQHKSGEPQLFFQSHNADNPNQPTFEALEKDGE